MNTEYLMTATNHLTIHLKQITVIDGKRTTLKKFTYNPLTSVKEAIQPVKDLAAEYFTPEVTAEYKTKLNRAIEGKANSKLRDYSAELEIATANVINNN